MITKGISAGDIKAQVINALSEYLCDYIPYYQTTSGTYETIYKKTIDATYVDTLIFHGVGSSNDLYYKVNGGGAAIVTKEGSANGHTTHSEDLSATTGDYVIEIVVKDNTGGVNPTLTDICLWSVFS